MAPPDPCAVTQFSIMANQTSDMLAIQRLGIRELLDRYHAAVNHLDFPLLTTLFAVDAVWEAAPPVGLRFQGREAVLAGLRTSMARQELLVQSNSGVVIEMTGPDEASVRSTLIEFGREVGTGAGWRAIAFYYDRVVREDGVWRFRQRSLRVRYMEDVAVPGQLFDVEELEARGHSDAGRHGPS
jgi:hypothetical protein